MGSRTGPREDAGVRAEVRVGAPGACPVAAVSAETGATIGSVDRAAPDEDGVVVEDFSVDRAAPDEDGVVVEDFSVDGSVTTDRAAVSEVFADGEESTYRFERRFAEPCVCETIERCGPPAAEIRAEDGALTVTFVAPDVETVADVVEGLRGRFDEIRVRRLTRSGAGADGDLVVLDRGRLTDRQREVLETAHRMGYFAYPKGANASDVAAALDISPSTFAEHLGAAQRKLLDQLLDP